MQEFTDLAIFEGPAVLRATEIRDAAEAIGIAGWRISLNISRLDPGPLAVANDQRFIPETDECFGILMTPGETFRFLTEMNRRAPHLGTDLSDMMLTTGTPHNGDFVWFPQARPV